MRKKVVIVLAIISILIIIFGFVAAKSIKSELTAESIQQERVVAEALSEIGSGLLSISIIIYSFLLVAAIWGIYGIVILILFIIKKIKEKRNIKR